MSPPTRAGGWRWPPGARRSGISKARDAFIGWDDEQRRKRLPLLANNARLLVLPDCHFPNLISRFMKLMLARLSGEWQSAWGHPLAMVETFVDPQLYQGTAYKVSGCSCQARRITAKAAGVACIP